VAFDRIAVGEGGGGRSDLAVATREALGLLASVLAPGRHHEGLEQDVGLLAAAVEPPLVAAGAPS
jgi:hypothetical protein